MPVPNKGKISLDEKIDEASLESFPASDPPAWINSQAKMAFFSEAEFRNIQKEHKPLAVIYPVKNSSFYQIKIFSKNNDYCLEIAGHPKIFDDLDSATFTAQRQAVNEIYIALPRESRDKAVDKSEYRYQKLIQ